MWSQVFLSSIVIAVVAGRADIPAIKRCGNVALAEECSNSKYSSIRASQLATAIACNSTRRANDIAGECARDTSNGLYCGAAHFYVTDINSARGACFTSIGSMTCSNECNNSLTALRNDLGCCINTIYNRSDSTYVPVFSYSLWSSCGVETVLAGGCPGGEEYTFTPEQTCSQAELETKVLSIACTQNLMSDLQTFFTSKESNCEPYLEHLSSICSVDGSNNFCLANDIAADIQTYIVDILQSCDTDCNSTCKSSLQKFVDERDCCISSLHNSTFSEVIGLNDTFDFSLHDQCGIEAPDTCDIRLTTTGSGRMLTPLGLLAFILLLLTLVAIA